MKLPKKKEIGNLLFSAFLITAYLICAYFLVGLIDNSFTEQPAIQALLTAGVFCLFGLLLFYATRVGDGKQVWRFSPVTLIVMVLPALYIILADVITGLPLHSQIVSRTELVYLAGAVLGYGIPYTFLSGYELRPDDENTAGSADSNEETAAVDETSADSTEEPAAVDETSADSTEEPAAVDEISADSAEETAAVDETFTDSTDETADSE